MNNDVKVRYRKIEPKIMSNKGYINLDNMKIETKEDLAEISNIFRNPVYETFRMIYMKKNRIIGYESISSKEPNYVKVFPSVNKRDVAKCTYKIKNRMERLNADGYYMVHNHPSGNTKASLNDIKITKFFRNNIYGFKGHLIINLDSYGWIDVDEKGNAYVQNCIPIKKRPKDRIYKMMMKKSIYNIKIDSRKTLVYLMHNIKNTQDYSIAVLTDSVGMVRMILDIPNRFMNMPTEQLKGYFNNLAKVSGSVRTLFATTNNDVYDKSIKTVREGIFTDSICYQKEKNKMYVYDKILKDDLDIMEYHILKNKIISIKQHAENMNKSHHIQERKTKENER